METTEDSLVALLESEGYFAVRRLADGTYAGLLRLAFTVGLHTNLTEFSWSRRFCYESLNLAQAALADLTAWDDEPEPLYIARRPQ